MPYERQKPIEILNRDELDQLLAACGKSITGVRNRAALAVMFFAGLRTQELIDLRAADVKLEVDGTAKLNVRSGKGGRQRHATLAAPGVPYLQAWIDLRGARTDAGRTAPLFCTHSAGGSGKSLDPGYVRAMLARLASRVDIGKRIHAHCFRHSHASYLFHRGVPVAAIGAQLGHSSPLTTVRYLASIGANDAHRHIAAAFTA